MSKRSLKSRLGVRGTIIGAALAATLVAVPVVIASGTGHDGGGLTLLSKASATNTTSVTFTVTNDIYHALDGQGATPLAVTVTCTTSSTKLDLSGGPFYEGQTTNLGTPHFTNCTDNFGGTDTVKTNNKLGSWTAKYNDASDASGETLGAGDTIDIKSPQAGLSTASTTLPGCLITANPAGTDGAANGAYNDQSGVLAISNQTLSFQVSQVKGKTQPQCPLTAAASHAPVDDAGTAAFTGSYQLKPVLTDS